MSEMMERVARAIFETWATNRSVAESWDEVCRLDHSVAAEARQEALAAIHELGEPTAEMLKGGMEVLEESQKMGEPLEAQVGRVWWEMICIAQPAPGSTPEDSERWEKIFAEAVAEVRAERT